MNEDANEYEPIKQAVAQAIGCECENLKGEKYDSYGMQVFCADGQEWAIGTDAEAAEAVKQYINDNVWTFRPEFIASHTKGGASNGVIKAITALQDLCESCNEDVKA